MAMTQDCFVCSKTINGDAAFFQFHLNSCLDGSSAPSPPPAPSADYVAALAYDDEQDEAESIKLARQLSAGEFEPHDDVAPGCPLCERTWTELELDSAGEKESHADGCAVSADRSQRRSEEREESIEPVASGSGSSGSMSFALGSGGEKDVVVGTRSKYRNCVPLDTQADIIPSTDIIPLLHPMFSRAHDEGKTRMVYLCDEKIEHVATKFTDMGWGCGSVPASVILPQTIDEVCTGIETFK